MRKLTLLAVVVAIMATVFAAPALAKIVSGTNDDDNLRGTRHADQMSGYNGEDTILGRAAADDLWGGADNDEVRGGPGPDDITAGTGNDDLVGGRGNDTLYAVDGWEDDVFCGPRYDVVFSDVEEKGDYVDPDCEEDNPYNHPAE